MSNAGVRLKRIAGRKTHSEGARSKREVTNSDFGSPLFCIYKQSEMRNYLLILNGVGIKDYYTRGRAEAAFARMVRHLNSKNDVLELYDINTQHRICSTI